jgi:hypothetical protein
VCAQSVQKIAADTFFFPWREIASFGQATTPINITVSECHALRFDRSPSYNTFPCEAAMPFSIRLFRRFPVQCVASYSVGPFIGIGTVWNLSRSGWRLSGDLPMRPGESLSLTVTLPNEQRIEVPEAVVRWSRGQEFGIETVETPKHTQARLIHYVRRLVKDSVEVLHE